MTFFPERVAGAKFRPKTGDYFVFSKDIGGNEFFQLYRYDMSSGEVTMLTDGKSRNVGTVWSHGGEWLAYGSTRRNGKDVDVYLVNPSDPKTTRMLLQVEGGGWGVEDFSPDDKKVLVGEGVSANESYLWLVDASTGEKTPITPKGGAEKVHYGGGQFSKDGRGIYTTTDKDSEFHRLAYVDLATKEYTYLTDHIKWDVADFDALARRQDHRLHHQRGRRKPPAPPRHEDAQGEEGHDEPAHWTHERPTVARERPRPRLRLHERALGRGRLLASTFRPARSSAGPRARRAASTSRTCPTRSSCAGSRSTARQISGFLYMPPSGKFTGARPVIINIHGGPEGQSLPGFLGRNNYFLNEMGVAMIFPNVRGSTGYGKTFLALDNGFKREDSYKDIGALLDWIKTQPQLDASRVMVTGGCYGGHMAFAIATLYSDRIKASLPVVGISNLVSFLERTEAYRRDLRRVEYGDERDPKMREFMLKIAPLNNAKNITKPLFVVAGGNDPRVPVNEAEQMVKTVRSNNTPVWYLMAKDEGHGFAKKKNQDYQFYATIMFVRETLLK